MFKIVTIGISIPDHIRVFRKKCDMKKIECVVLGEELKKPFMWGDKLLLMYDYVNKSPDDELIMCLDATDVIILGNKNEIYNKFVSFNKPLVFGAEIDNIFSSFPYDDFPILSTTSPFKFVNSGTYMGTVKAIRDVFDYYKPQNDPRHAYNPICWDQGWWADCLVQNHDAFHLDTNCDLFQIFHSEKYHYPNTRLINPYEIDEYSYNNHRLYNNLTGTCPPIIHFAGCYCVMESVIKLLISNGQGIS